MQLGRNLVKCGVWPCADLASEEVGLRDLMLVFIFLTKFTRHPLFVWPVIVFSHKHFTGTNLLLH